MKISNSKHQKNDEVKSQEKQTVVKRCYERTGKRIQVKSVFSDERSIADLLFTITISNLNDKKVV